MTSMSSDSRPILSRTAWGEKSLISPSKTVRLAGSLPASRLRRIVSQNAGIFSTQATTSNMPVACMPMSRPMPPENSEITLYLLMIVTSSKWAVEVQSTHIHYLFFGGVGLRYVCNLFIPLRVLIVTLPSMSL